MTVCKCQLVTLHQFTSIELTASDKNCTIDKFTGSICSFGLGMTLLCTIVKFYKRKLSNSLLLEIVLLFTLNGNLILQFVKKVMNKAAKMFTKAHQFPKETNLQEQLKFIINKKSIRSELQTNNHENVYYTILLSL